MRASPIRYSAKRCKLVGRKRQQFSGGHLVCIMSMRQQRLLSYLSYHALICAPCIVRLAHALPYTRHANLPADPRPVKKDRAAVACQRMSKLLLMFVGQREKIVRPDAQWLLRQHHLAGRFGLLPCAIIEMSARFPKQRLHIMPGGGCGMPIVYRLDSHMLLWHRHAGRCRQHGH